MDVIKKLSEAILLQSLEDLFSEQTRIDALRFFNGEGFNICASIIGLNHEETQKIFALVKKSRPIKHFAPPVQIEHKIKHIPKVTHGLLHRNVRHEAVCAV